MTSAGAVRVDMAGILSKLEANGFDEVHIEFVPTQGPSVAAVSALNAAVLAANAADPETFGTAPVASVSGCSTKMMDFSGEEQLSAWLMVIARELMAGGWAGALRATPTVAPPKWLGTVATPRLSIYALGDQLFDPRGRVDGLSAALAGEKVIAHWCDLAATWMADLEADVYLCNGGIQQLAPPSDIAAAYLDLALRTGGSGIVIRAGAVPGAAARSCLNVNGQTVLQWHDPEAAPADLAARARAVLLAWPAQTGLAFVSMSPFWAYGWADRARGPVLPAADRETLGRNSPLWTEVVPDVHGMQLLTAAHIRNAADLSGWTMTPAGDGRILVEAPDLAPWLGPADPPEDVLARARQDFGSMILGG